MTSPTAQVRLDDGAMEKAREAFEIAAQHDPDNLWDDAVMTATVTAYLLARQKKDAK